jgi:hypothetical protein
MEPGKRSHTGGLRDGNSYQKTDGLPPSQGPNELTEAPKARIVSFPTRQQATGTELLLWLLPLSPDPSGLFLWPHQSI